MSLSDTTAQASGGRLCPQIDTWSQVTISGKKLLPLTVEGGSEEEAAAVLRVLGAEREGQGILRRFRGRLRRGVTGLRQSTRKWSGSEAWRPRRWSYTAAADWLLSRRAVSAVFLVRCG